MIKSIIVLTALAAVLGQEYELIDNNLVDFSNSPYQSISLPYPYQDDIDRRVINIQRKPIKNAIVVNNGLEEIERPAVLTERVEVNTSLSNMQTSLISTICAVGAKLFLGLKTALKLLIFHIPALLFGAILMIGFCKITSVCNKIGSIQSLMEAQREFNSLITPERLDMASEFIQKAVRRYRSIQTN